MTVPFILLALGAYLLGSVPVAYLAVRWARGEDIRKVGTGKIGASNVLRVGGKWLAIPVAIFDIGKGALAVWIARLLGMETYQQVTVGVSAIIGHNWPVFLKFSGGGRGVFASLGVITMLSWKLGLLALVFSYLFAPFRQVALGVLFAYVGLPLLSWFVAAPFDIEEKLAVTLGLIAIALIGVTRRLIAHRSELSKEAPWGEILLNRLFFDRDIGDQRLWITRSSSQKNQ